MHVLFLNPPVVMTVYMISVWALTLALFSGSTIKTTTTPGEQGDFSDWGSNADKSDDASSVLSAGGQSTLSSALGALQRIDESSEQEHSPTSPLTARRKATANGSGDDGGGGGDARMDDSRSTAAMELDTSTSRGGRDGPRRLESVSFADDPPGEDSTAAVRGGAAGAQQKQANVNMGTGMSLAERARGGSSPSVSRRCDGVRFDAYLAA